MRQFIYRTKCCFIVLTLLSFTGEWHRPPGIDYWVLYSKERELASGGQAMTVVLSKKEMATIDTIWFYYRPCARSYEKRYTQLLLESPSAKTLLVSSENSVDYYTGKFTLSRLRAVAKRFRTDSLVLVAKMEPNWTERLVTIKLQP